MIAKPSVSFLNTDSDAHGWRRHFNWRVMTVDASEVIVQTAIHLIHFWNHLIKSIEICCFEINKRKHGRI